MVKLVSTLGTSPGGVAETLQNLSTGKYIAPFEPKEIKFDEFIVLRTKGTEEAYYALRAILLCCIGFEKIKEVVFPFNDIENPKDFITVRETVREILKPGDFMDFTGGRKAISAAAVLSARDVGAHLVSTIIDQKEYGEMIVKFNKLKDKLESVYSKGDCRSYFCDLMSSTARTIVFF
ncbi:CRISPR-associated ring nuclease Crn1 [Sulfurisphaera ohwakuensis]|uniref:CRISPR-associated protein n=1 Tax=Sulfurisphaera ohwakuensis TaxID=69656 RepID=A0A650CKJ0_SULOH|nr:CRISPR-associated ring nuclease Crn1 [Sulfurisphaera ohwakuensis]MBB5254596.1 hypothetical protein [Sulfurisphaera ohwakuensis]QGR18272.1 hypothetical protein D1869_14565 [Sulfurisphaera ohwakuensis]